MVKYTTKNRLYFIQESLATTSNLTKTDYGTAYFDLRQTA